MPQDIHSSPLTSSSPVLGHHSQEVHASARLNMDVQRAPNPGLALECSICTVMANSPTIWFHSSTPARRLPSDLCPATHQLWENHAASLPSCSHLHFSSAVLSQQSLSGTQRGPWVWTQHCVCLAQQHLSGTCFAWRSLSQSLRSGLRGFLGLGLCPLGPLHPWAAVSVGMYSVVGATVLSLEFHTQKRLPGGRAPGRTCSPCTGTLSRSRKRELLK